MKKKQITGKMIAKKVLATSMAMAVATGYAPMVFADEANAEQAPAAIQPESGSETQAESEEAVEPEVTEVKEETVSVDADTKIEEAENKSEDVQKAREEASTAVEENTEELQTDEQQTKEKADVLNAENFENGEINARNDAVKDEMDMSSVMTVDAPMIAVEQPVKYFVKTDNDRKSHRGSYTPIIFDGKNTINKNIKDIVFAGNAKISDGSTAVYAPDESIVYNGNLTAKELSDALVEKLQKEDSKKYKYLKSVKPYRFVKVGDAIHVDMEMEYNEMADVRYFVKTSEAKNSHSGHYIEISFGDKNTINKNIRSLDFEPDASKTISDGSTAVYALDESIKYNGNLDADGLSKEAVDKFKAKLSDKDKLKYKYVTAIRPYRCTRVGDDIHVDMELVYTHQAEAIEYYIYISDKNDIKDHHGPYKKIVLNGTGDFIRYNKDRAIKLIADHQKIRSNYIKYGVDNVLLNGFDFELDQQKTKDVYGDVTNEPVDINEVDVTFGKVEGEKTDYLTLKQINKAVFDEWQKELSSEEKAKYAKVVGIEAYRFVADNPLHLDMRMVYEGETNSDTNNTNTGSTNSNTSSSSRSRGSSTSTTVINDAPVPLSEKAETTIEDAEVPLAEAPVAEIAEEAVPLAELPKTGGIGTIFFLVSGTLLAGLGLLLGRRKNN